MRKVVASELVSLDGVVQSPEEWQLTYFNDEMGEEIGAAMAASDAMLLGRDQPVEKLPWGPLSTWIGHQIRQVSPMARCGEPRWYSTGGSRLGLGLVSGPQRPCTWREPRRAGSPIPGASRRTRRGR
jgi:hypothetical protein